MKCSLWKGKGTYNIIHEKKTFLKLYTEANF